MKYYIGIDLGTTNSAISVYDGQEVRVYKSRQGQSDVTPSNIFIDKNGKQFCGQRAYNQLGNQADRVAKQFKRFMGTGTNIEFAGISMTPIECSAEILKELMRCLPEEIMNSNDKATVITVPAAFDQRQNAATEEAAKLANIGKVALMQEPVAAIVRAVKDKNKNGCFFVFDIGGGTLDCAIATNLNGKVDVIAHGGVAMCGGADMDMKILDNIVIPWLYKNYSLPQQIRGIEKYEKMLKIARFHSEQAKIELSSSEDADIYGSLHDIDETGEEIYLDINITRDEYNKLIEDLIMEAVEAARETIKKSAVPINDFDRIVFIGGPANYKYLRDRVVGELGIKSEGLEINPMTAVSEGAAIFAETIDWSSEIHERKGSHAEILNSKELGLSFKYDSRTTENKAKIGVKLEKTVSGYSFQICSVDTGWDSGMLPLENGNILRVPLAKIGDNVFEIFVFDSSSRKIKLEEDTITISKVNASVGAILASHSIGIEVKDSVFSDNVSLDYLVKEGDKLPVKGKRKYKATETIKAGSSNSILIKMWEGDISDNISDNRYVGCMKLEGTDLEYGSIKAGAELIFNYTISEAGTINVDVTIPSLDDISFNSGHNFYAYNDGQIDMTDEDTINEIVDDAVIILQKANTLENDIEDERLDSVRKLAYDAIDLKETTNIEPEVVKKNFDNLLKAKILLDKIKTDNVDILRQVEFDRVLNNYKNNIEVLCDSIEQQQFNDLFETAKNVIQRADKTFEDIIKTIDDKIFFIKFNKDNKFVVSIFQYCRTHRYMYTDKVKADQLIKIGENLIENNEYNKLRRLIVDLYGLARESRDIDGINDIANIMRG